jgi:RNA-directed DNA polymerase
MHDHGKSDGPVVPAKLPNKPGDDPGAEVVEGRGSAKGNTAGEARPGRSAGLGVSSDLDRVRQVARRDREVRFTALLHHVTVDRLRDAYRAISPNAAAGADGVTWRGYGADLEGNLCDLQARVARGAFRASPTRRVFIPKADGRLRPLGVAALEDKIVQRAIVEVLNAVYEQDFLGFSYGFRPGRGPHDALDALAVAITTERVNWVLDADIRDFFTSLDHGWLGRFLEHRIADQRVLRLIQKWLRAGVIQDGEWSETERGTAQGASISPLLANVYLHYVFDLWADQWRRRNAHGDVILVRFADDYVAGFEHRDDAERFWADLRDRFAEFSLELAEDKTRLIEFGRFAARNRERRGDPTPDTFDFLGFTHICAKTKTGRFKLKRVTSKKKMRAKLKSVKTEMRRRMHLPIPPRDAGSPASSPGTSTITRCPTIPKRYEHSVTRPSATGIRRYGVAANDRG